MAKGKASPLGSNPLKGASEQVLRDMVRGEPPPGPPETQGLEAERPGGSFGSPSRGKAKKAELSTVTPGGLLRKTVYFQPEEWQAIRQRCLEEDIKYTELVRAAVRRYLKIK